MTEYSHFWGGEHIGDIASDWRVSDEDFSRMMRRIFGLGADYTFTVGLPAGYSIKVNGGVIKGRDNELEVYNPAGTAIWIRTGAAVVDGHLYYSDTARAVGNVTAPGAGTNYYLVGLRSEEVEQYVRQALIGPETDPANLVQPWTENSDLMEVLAAVSIDNLGAITIYDIRRFLRPMGYQIPVLIARQGDDGSEQWDAVGTDTIDIGSGVGIMFGCFEFTGTQTSGYARMYVGETFQYGLVKVTHAGADPRVICGARLRQDAGAASNEIWIQWIVNDAVAIADPQFHFVLIGKLSPEYQVSVYPDENEARTTQDE